MALTAKVKPYKDGFGPFAPETYRVPMSYPFRDPEKMTGEEAAWRAIDQFETQVGASHVAAVLIEPIQGEGGFIVPAEGFLPTLAEWCEKNGALFIADEIQSGFGRTGKWFASEHEGIVPDLVTTAKGLAGGMPLAGVTGGAEVMNTVHPGGLGGTYGGNPVACAAAIGAIERDARGRPRRGPHTSATCCPIASRGCAHCIPRSAMCAGGERCKRSNSSSPARSSPTPSSRKRSWHAVKKTASSCSRVARGGT